MKYTVLGDSDCPLIEIQLDRGEECKIERGSMAYLRDVDLVGRLNSKSSGLGGILNAMGRSIGSGESMFITTATGKFDGGVIGIAPPIPGKINVLEVFDGRQYCLNTGAFLACDQSVHYGLKRQSLSKALFARTGGLFVVETSGTGQVLVSSFGDLIELEVKDNQPLIVDNLHVVAWDSNLQYSLEIASGTFGFTTGEGIVNRFTGNGKVLIQTRNLINLAQAVAGYIDTSD